MTARPSCAVDGVVEDAAAEGVAVDGVDRLDEHADDVEPVDQAAAGCGREGAASSTRLGPAPPRA